LLRLPTLPAGFVAPCLPTKIHTLPSGAAWIHEIKHDGFRIIVWRSCSTRTRAKIAARPLKDLDAKWAASDDAAVAFTKMVYNSFKRS
jgi:ATP-dependent DNA ligase